MRPTMAKPRGTALPIHYRDILLVDDSGADCRFIEHALKRSSASYHIDSAHTAADARRKIAEKHYDCMLIDYRLPDLDGLELMESIHRDIETGFPGLVMISGEGSERVAAKAIKLGAHDYLSKNQLNSGRLQEVIDSAIRRAQEKRSQVHQQMLMENFASTAAHDLANPLNGVIGFVSLAQQMMERGEIDQIPDYLDSALKAAHYMKQLVIDLLHFARTGSSAEACEPVNLTDTVQLAANLLEEAIEASGAVIELETLPKIEGYVTELTQMFQNLIANSIKYHSDARPVITISAEDMEDSCIITITDNGCGVPASARRQIFSPLFRIHRKNTTGSGLGLATCAKIAEMHHGRIWCEGRATGGSRFKIELPKKQPDQNLPNDMI
ncbi:MULTISPECIES: sensor histidine kinase [Kordiimonas]|uniref:sensor histidine kinase n=1 Tax=Kordiimonas TaxID=288021 RepID=UPI002579E11D|nr:hybrid sensor histidine kinase/response regulator [Kordiimonas sp. UBA4487]